MRKSIFFGLSLLGLFDALYLLWTYVSPSRPMVCIGGGCDAVRASAYAYPWGVPMPVFGVAGYVLIILLVIADPLFSSGVARLARYVLAAGTTFGFLFSAYLEYLQGFVIHAYCTWCVTSGVVMTVLCALALYDALRPGPEGDAPAQLDQVRSYFVVGVAALLLGVPAFYGLARHGEAPPAPKAPTEALAARLVRSDSHATGNLNAALSVIEFGDFQCPVCGPEEKVMHEIRAKIYKTGSFCIPAVSPDPHPPVCLECGTSVGVCRRTGKVLGSGGRDLFPAKRLERRRIASRCGRNRFGSGQVRPVPAQRSGGSESPAGSGGRESARSECNAHVFHWTSSPSRRTGCRRVFTNYQPGTGSPGSNVIHRLPAARGLCAARHVCADTGQTSHQTCNHFSENRTRQGDRRNHPVGFRLIRVNAGWSTIQFLGRRGDVQRSGGR